MDNTQYWKSLIIKFAKRFSNSFLAGEDRCSPLKRGLGGFSTPVKNAKNITQTYLSNFAKRPSSSFTAGEDRCSLLKRGLGGFSTPVKNAKNIAQTCLYGFIQCFVLFTLCLIFALPSSAQDEGKFTIARLKYSGGGDWYVGQTTIPNLLKGLRERTNVETGDKQAVIQLVDKELYSHPFIYMTGHGNVSFTDDEVRRLRLYLTRGGFLWANDDYGMDKSFRREMKRVFPDKNLVEIPFDHDIYHCYYDFPNGLPKIHEHDGKPPRGYGLFHEGRMIVFYDYESDIGNGLENPEVHKDPPEKREQALRMAINLVIYVLTH